MKSPLSTLSVTIVIAGSLVMSATPRPATPAVAATPKATSTPGKAVKGDVCAPTKSKWAHLQCEQFNSSAPGDEYFGRMKMSYLGIDNTYKDGVVSAGAYSTDARLIAKLDFATEALQRWAAKYPNDPELPRSYFLAIQVLRKIYTQAEQQTTWQFMQLLVTKYGSSYFGKAVKASIARGFTEHWFALAQICPTPLPAGEMPDNVPNATPSPATGPGRAAIELITPPCVQPSIVPEESQTPMAAPTQGPTGEHLRHPMAQPSGTPAPGPSPTVIPRPTETPAARPSRAPAIRPSRAPVPGPTETPTAKPSNSPVPGPSIPPPK